VQCEAGGTPLDFQGSTFCSLNPFQRSAHGIRLCADHLQFRPLAKVILGFVRTAQAIEHQAAKEKGPWIAAAASDGRVQRIERFAIVLGEEGVDAAAV
jgi:hypothetical protein